MHSVVQFSDSVDPVNQRTESLQALTCQMSLIRCGNDSPDAPVTVKFSKIMKIFMVVFHFNTTPSPGAKIKSASTSDDRARFSSR